jgi:hypothetical protein
VEGFKVGNGSSEDAFISFDTLFVNLQSVSLFRGGFIVKEFRIEKPYLGIVRNENKSYNFLTSFLRAQKEKRLNRQKMKKV